MKSSFIVKQQEKMNARKLERFTRGKCKPAEHFENGCNGVVYTFEEQRNNTNWFLAVGFKGNRIRNQFYYRFRSAQERLDYIDNFFIGLLKQQKIRAERKVTMKAQKERLSKRFVVGTVLTGSWGYEQTNREFYQVVEKYSDFKLSIRPIGSEIIEGSEGHDSCYVKPIKNHFCGHPITKMVSPWGISFDNFTLNPCKDNSKHYKSWGY